MAEKNLAYITPEVLAWARKFAQTSIDEAAKTAGVNYERIVAWENGDELPTVRQAKLLANKFKVSFTCFLMASPPNINLPKTRDYRKISSKDRSGEISREVKFLLKDIVDRRETILELQKELGYAQQRFTKTIEPDFDKNKSLKNIAFDIRSFLKISYEDVSKIRDASKSFNYFRLKFEQAGILVFQSTDVSLNEMRGMSVFYDIYPVIIVNRKDAPNARSFTLFHELVHILTRTPGICDSFEDDYLDNDIEAYCNKIAGESLVPEDNLKNESILQGCTKNQVVSDYLRRLSKTYGVSREVIARRLLDLGYVDQKFYKRKREEFTLEYKLIEESRDKSKGKGFILPHVNTVSASGKLYTGVVLDAYNQNIITPADAASFLGLRTKHFPKLEEMVMRT